MAAAVLTLMGALFFALMNAAAKHLLIFDLENSPVQQDMPVLQITFVRYAVAALLMLPLMVAKPARFGMLDLSRNCAAPLTAYYTQKENDYGNETYDRI